MKKLLPSIIFLNLLLLGAQLLLTFSRATDGDKLAHMDSRLQELEAANRDIAAEVYRLSSTGALLEAARKAEYIPVKITSVSPAPVADISVP